ncbi:MAG: DUF1343 domain-containing protein [Acidobacteriota bacterium]|nr:MAG: DUF1343 domain-containing protein [Acidobacteriota bacterium]
MKLLCVVFASALHVSSPQTSVTVVTPGVDVVRLEGERLARLRGKRIGLITNHTGRAIDGTPTLQVLRRELGLDVVTLFSPEHGFAGNVAAGDNVSSDESGAIPVFSLYGDIRAPTREMLAGVDVLVFDIQDIGVRFYTYISTMKLAMDAAARAGVAFVVLDRPNPNGGTRVEGPVLETELTSFVGVAPIPLLHGMTVGELAHLFQDDRLELDVVLVRGWTRDLIWEETGLPWTAPSPNIRSPRAALAYPALGLLEGINVSEGRGIEETFERIGAPWIDGERLSSLLNGLDLEGASFRPTSFVPRRSNRAPRPKYENERCTGIELTITLPHELDAVRTGLEVIVAIRTLHPDDFEWIRNDERYWIDRLLGTDRPRHAIEEGMSVEDILESERPALERFMRLRAEHLLY